MKISIITVVYNAKETIEETIKSVLNQTYENIEYLIIDGGSNDGTNEIISKYENQINYYISEPDNGLYDAMNKGIKASNGEIIGILNADDTFYSEEVIQKIVNFHVTNEKIQASIGNIIQHNENGKILRKYSSEKWNPKLLKYGFMPPHPSIFFKRNTFEKFGFYSLDYKIGADFDLIVRYFLVNQITWKYSGVITTKMLVGGLSSSGLTSYMKISKEIRKALINNNVSNSSIIIYLRIIWKIRELIKRKSI